MYSNISNICYFCSTVNIYYIYYKYIMYIRKGRVSKRIMEATYHNELKFLPIKPIRRKDFCNSSESS